MRFVMSQRDPAGLSGRSLDQARVAILRPHRYIQVCPRGFSVLVIIRRPVPSMAGLVQCVPVSTLQAQAGLVGLSVDLGGPRGPGSIALCGVKGGRGMLGLSHWGDFLSPCKLRKGR